ncbi:MAG: WD40 repeat domain-containing protein [Alphaproteobacteria bacterium]|nr:WD40 repeat domain-containing protein [Alphaproteobacteria bacterium]
MGPITAVDVDPLGRAVTGGYDGRLVGWERDGRKPRWVAERPALINSVRIAGDRVYVVGADRVLAVHDLGCGTQLRTTSAELPDDLNVVDIAPCGTTVAVGGETGGPYFYRLPDLAPVLFRTSIARCVNGLSFLTWNGRSAICLGDDDGWLTIIDVPNQEIIAEFDLGATVETVRPTADRNGILVGLEDGRVMQLSTRDDGAVVRNIVTEHLGAVKSIAVSIDGDIASSAYDGLIKCVLKGGRRRTLELAGEAWQGWSRGLSFDPSDSGQLVASSLGTVPQIWDVKTGALRLPDAKSTLGLNAIDATHDGKIFAGGDYGVLFQVVGKDVTSTDVSSMLTAVSVNAAGSVAWTGAFDGQVRRHDPASGRTTTNRLLDTTPVNCLAIDSAARSLAAGTYSGLIELMDPDTLVGRKAFRTKAAIKALTFVDDFNRLVAGLADGRLVAWDLATERIVFVIDGLTLVNAVAWSKSRGLLAATGRDLALRLISPDGDVVAECHEVHERSVKTLAWSPSGKFLATGSYDATVAVWRVEEKPILVGRFTGHDRPGVAAVRWISDEALASAGWDGAIRIWCPMKGLTSTYTPGLHA